MKSSLIGLMLLSGCATSGLQTLEAKYLPGNCAKLTKAAIATGPAASQKSLGDLELYVAGVGVNSYGVVQLLPLIGPVSQGQADMTKFNDTTELSECSDMVKELVAPQK